MYRAIIPVFALLLAVLLSACGSGSDIAEDDGTPESASAVTATSASDTADDASPTPTTENVATLTSEAAPTATAMTEPTETREPTPTTEPTATATSTPLPEPEAIAIVSQGFGQDPDGREVGWAFVIENPNPSLAVEDSQYQLAVMDEAGTVLETDSGYINLLLPGERTAVAGSVILTEGAKAESIDITLNQGDSESLEAVVGFTSENVAYLADEYTPKASGIVANPFNRDLIDLRLSAVAYDGNGAIIGGGFTFLNFIPAQGKTGVTVSVTSSAEPATVELYASITSLTLLADSTSKPSDATPLVLTAQGFGQEADSPEVGWGFVVGNSNQDQSFENSLYRAVAYDESGTVIGSDSGYINLLLPGERLGFGGDIYVTDGRVASRVDVQVLAGDAVDDVPEAMFAVENVNYVADQYVPKATGTVKNLTAETLEDIRVSAIAYNEAGEVTGGGFTYVGFVPAQGQAAAEVSITTSAVPARVELYPTVTSLTFLGQ